MLHIGCALVPLELRFFFEQYVEQQSRRPREQVGAVAAAGRGVEVFVETARPDEIELRSACQKSTPGKYALKRGLKTIWGSMPFSHWLSNRWFSSLAARFWS